MNSLRLLFSLLVLLGIVLTVSLSSFLSAKDVKFEIEEIFDAQMMQTAKMLEQFYVNQLTSEQLIQLIKKPILVHVNDSEINTFAEINDPDALLYEQKFSFQLLSSQGELVAYSDSSGKQVLTEFTQGYQTKVIAEELWHVYSVFSSEKSIWIVTGQRDDVRQELADLIISNTWQAPVVITPIMMCIMLLLTYFLFKPIKKLERHLAGRQAQDLSPIQFSLPSELASVQNALNHYLLRISDAMARERRFSADAAHELKTPLAIIKLHSGALADELKTQGEDIYQNAQPYMHAIEQGVNRINHTVEQLLLLSRIDALSALNRQECQLQTLIDNVFNQLVYLVTDYEWNVEIPDGLIINVDPFYLEVVLKNILENACKYSPKESAISITATQHANQTLIEVCDEGRGMTSEEITLAKNRFYRADETKSQGAGLGLAICQHIISLHQGELILKPIHPKGLSVSILLPS